jgi:hypothetical protein
MSEDNAALRKSIYVLLIVAACGTMIGRIWTVQSSLGSTPLLSANDRSRWATVRALVDHGTFELDEVIFLDAAQTRRNREWYSIDMVRHRGADGREHYYSSKPPLLATLVAGKYWLLKQVTGITLGEHPFYAARFLLITTNVIPHGLVLPGAGVAGRTFRDDRLGAFVRDDLRDVRHLPDHLQRHADQSSAGGRQRRDRHLGGAGHLAGRPAELAAVRRLRILRGVHRDERTAGFGFLCLVERGALLAGASSDLAGFPAWSRDRCCRVLWHQLHRPRHLAAAVHPSTRRTAGRHGAGNNRPADGNGAGSRPDAAGPVGGRDRTVPAGTDPAQVDGHGMDVVGPGGPQPSGAGGRRTMACGFTVGATGTSTNAVIGRWIGRRGWIEGSRRGWSTP